MKIYLVRHGQSTGNITGTLNSFPDDSITLTELGIKQAKTAQEKLKDIKFDKIYTSELQRAKQTADIISSNQEKIIDERLNDIHTGCDGKTLQFYHSHIKSDWYDGKFGDGESRREFKERIISFLKELQGETILIVSHYDPIRIIYGYFNNLSIEESYDLKVSNCQIFEIEIK